MATETNDLLLAIRPDYAEGHRLLAERWPGFVETLRAGLRQQSREEAASREELLLFRYPDPVTALNSWLTSLRNLKEQAGWESPFTPAPFRIILHLVGDDDPGEPTLPPPLNEPDSGAWNDLQPEIPHLTTALRQSWRELVDPGKFISHRLEEEKSGLSPLIIDPSGQPGRPPLFPHRHLPLAGKLPPCFYCGFTNHEPAACPAKMLTLQIQGLPTVGYLPLDQLSELFQQAMTRQGELNSHLLAGITSGQLRKDLLLQVYVSYFDLNKVFQPRFLPGIAFTTHSRWDQLGETETIHAENSTLFLGLDCLRVGQYHQADELFITESRRPKGKAIYALIGRALVALEQKRHHDMGHHLENALKMALSDRDRIYISLLLSRHYRLQGDLWKAAEALDNIISFDRECHEALYRQLQLAVAGGFINQALGQIRSLVLADPPIFMRILMDPELIPIQDGVEDLLRTRLVNQAQEAEENLAQARVSCLEMEHWLEEEEEELKALRGDLAIIEQQESQKSYFDLIDIAKKSRLLRNSCHRLQEARLDLLHERLEKSGQRLAGFRKLWRDYPYQSFFPAFRESLDRLGKVLGKADSEGLKNMHGALYRTLLNSLDECDRDFNTLQETTVRMIWLRTLFNGGKQFIRSLLVVEMVLISLTVLLLLTLIFLADASPTASGLTQLVREPGIQKRLLLLVTLILAPIIALTRTLWRMLEP